MLRTLYLSLILCCALFAISSQAFAQAFSDASIIEEVKSQLDAMSAEGGSLRAFCSKNNITGKFVFDLTVEGKGNVLTVFLVSSDTQDIPAKNLFKDKLYTLRFENIKVPKKERIKFRHTLNF